MGTRFRSDDVELDLIEIPSEWNRLTEQIIGCAMEVHTHLGCGLAERLYEDALTYEFRTSGLNFERQAQIAVSYKEITLSPQRMDLVVENLVVLELKCVEGITDVHEAQLLSYLRASGYPLGLLINFNTTRLKHGIRRKINDRRSAPGAPATSSHNPNPLRPPRPPRSIP